MADYRTAPPGDVPLDADPSSRVSDHFRLYELTRSEAADRLLIDNRFQTREHLEAAIHLCRSVLESVRGEFGPLKPNSVFRSQELERALKHKPEDWVSTSQHTLGEACDIEVLGRSTLELANWVQANHDFDQLICECYDPNKGPNAGWVHVSLQPPAGKSNRREVLSYVKEPGQSQYAYVSGLIASA